MPRNRRSKKSRNAKSQSVEIPLPEAPDEVNGRARESLLAESHEVESEEVKLDDDVAFTQDLLNDFAKRTRETDQPWANFVLVRPHDTEDYWTGFTVQLAHKGQLYEIWRYEDARAVEAEDDPWQPILDKAGAIWDTLQESGAVLAADEGIRRAAEAAAAEAVAAAPTTYRLSVAPQDRLDREPGSEMYIPDNFDGSQSPIVFLSVMIEGMDWKMAVTCGAMNWVPWMFKPMIEEFTLGRYRKQLMPARTDVLVGVSGELAAAAVRGGHITIEGTPDPR
jgi:hypothetical protein